MSNRSRGGVTLRLQRAPGVQLRNWLPDPHHTCSVAACRGRNHVRSAEGRRSPRRPFGPCPDGGRRRSRRCMIHRDAPSRRAQSRSSSAVMPKRVEFGARCLSRTSVKRGETFGLPQPVLVITDPRDELILPHPSVDGLSSLHELTPPIRPLTGPHQPPATNYGRPNSVSLEPGRLTASPRLPDIEHRTVVVLAHGRTILRESPAWGRGDRHRECEQQRNYVPHRQHLLHPDHSPA